MNTSFTKKEFKDFVILFLLEEARQRRLTNNTNVKSITAYDKLMNQIFARNMDKLLEVMYPMLAPKVKMVGSKSIQIILESRDDDIIRVIS